MLSHEPVHSFPGVSIIRGHGRQGTNKGELQSTQTYAACKKRPGTKRALSLFTAPLRRTAHRDLRLQARPCYTIKQLLLRVPHEKQPSTAFCKRWAPVFQVYIYNIYMNAIFSAGYRHMTFNHFGCRHRTEPSTCLTWAWPLSTAPAGRLRCPSETVTVSVGFTAVDCYSNVVCSYLSTAVSIVYSRDILLILRGTILNRTYGTHKNLCLKQ